MPLFNLIELPFCKVICLDSWNEPAHRYFIAYHVEDDFRHVLGLPVIDEFCTFSSPIFFAPIPILGKIYNAGISLGHKRDQDMSIDLGWPPLCIGYEAPSPELPVDWEARVLAEVQRTGGAGVQRSGEVEVQRVIVGQTEVIATNAPLLPEQLRRMCRTMSDAPFRIAFSTGNRLTRTEKGAPQTIRVSSEAVFASLLKQ